MLSHIRKVEKLLTMKIHTLTIHTLTIHHISKHSLKMASLITEKNTRSIFMVNNLPHKAVCRRRPQQPSRPTQHAYQDGRVPNPKKNKNLHHPKSRCKSPHKINTKKKFQMGKASLAQRHDSEISRQAACAST